MSSSLAEVEEARENVFLDKVRNVLKGGEYKRQDALIERLLEEGHSSTDIASAVLHLLQAGEGSAPKPERAATSERPAKASRPNPPERAPEPPRPAFERPQARPQWNEEYAEPPRRPVSERIIPPKRPASKPAVQIAPPKPKPAPTVAPAVPTTVEGEPGVAKPSRKTPDGQVRLFMNIGSEATVTPIDIVNSIAGETGLPGNVVGKVDVRERHLFVDVNTEHANAIITKLNRAEIKGRRVKVKLA